jgi:hypothetical protein
LEVERDAWEVISEDEDLLGGLESLFPLKSGGEVEVLNIFVVGDASTSGEGGYICQG